MSDIAIRAEGLSKRYRIGVREPYKALRDVLANAIYSPFRALSSALNGRRTIVNHPPDSYIWALKDVSFEVKQGEVVGIIGRNGAGKTTLLKILSRITEPTEGYVELHGRVGSLLEVGTGFHPELTGRENIYLNGAILGMRKAEIDHKFDEIVAFAEIEKFVDTPVKRYSSGMYMRLAFAVAAHLEPEILLVDEVLAVGDAAFQKKCLGKMGDVAREGRTVLLVSHNMAAIKALCGRAHLLNDGMLAYQGLAGEAIQHYLRLQTSSNQVPLFLRQDRSGDASARVVLLRVESTDPDKVIRSGSRLKITVGYRSERNIIHPQFLLGIYDCSDAGIFLLSSEIVGGLEPILPAEGTVTCITDPINLTPGRCYINVALQRGGVMADYVQHAAYFDVAADDLFGTGKIPPRDWVLCALRHRWQFEGSTITNATL